MRKLTGLIASVAVLVPAAALAQTAMPPTPWEDVPPAALKTPAAPAPSPAPAPAPAPPPGTSWQYHAPAAPPAAPPPPSDAQARRDHSQAAPAVRHDGPPAPRWGWHAEGEEHAHADRHDDRAYAEHRHGDWSDVPEGCRPLPGHRFECDARDRDYGYAYPYSYDAYGYGYPAYGYGGTVTVTETIVTTSGPVVSGHRHQDWEEAPRVRYRVHQPQDKPAPQPADEKG